MVKIKDSKELMKKISYKFRNEEYLKEALTHRSYSNENNRDKQFDNEKLEFLGDAFEALIGAIFKDSDYYTTKEIAMKYLMEKIENINDIEGTGDYKTILQELLQGEYRKMPEYELIRTAGPDHDKIFEISVKLNDKIIGNGSGKSKKEAEKNAAKEALKFVENKIKNKK